MSPLRVKRLAGVLLAVATLAGCGGESPPTAGAPAAAPPVEAGAVAPEPAPTAPVLMAERPPHYIFGHARMEAEQDAEGHPLGVRVISVQPRGRVGLAGVQAGDLIFYIDGLKLDSPENFPRAVRLVEDVFLRGRPQRIHVERDGKRMALIPLGPVKTEPTAPSP